MRVGPDCALGYSEAQLREQFDDRFPAFVKYMDMKAHPKCSGKSPCTVPHGYVYYLHDVLRFVERA